MNSGKKRSSRLIAFGYRQNVTKYINLYFTFTSEVFDLTFYLKKLGGEVD